MEYIKSLLSKKLLKYFRTVNECKYKSNSKILQLLHVIPKLFDFFFFLNRILLLSMKSVTFPVLHKTLKTFLHLHTSLKT